MEIIVPTYITDAMLVSCNTPEDDLVTYPAWDADADYPIGFRVSVADAGVHQIYESIANNPANTNKYPPDWLSVRTGYTVIYWSIVSATNRWKLFDMIVAPDRCAALDSSGDDLATLELNVTPGEIDSIAILNCDAAEVSITLTVSGLTVYTDTITPAVTIAANCIFSDIPSYPTATINVTLTQETGVTIRCGEIIFGVLKNLGTSKYGVAVSLIDFSKKDVDTFGNFSILERIYSKRIECTFMIDIAKHSGVLHILEKYRAIPLVWIVSDSYTTTSLYGFYRDLSMTISNTKIVDCTITVEGLGGDLINVTPGEDEWVEPWTGNLDLYTIQMPAFILTDPALLDPTPVSDSSEELVTFNVPNIATYAYAYNPLGACSISNASPAVVTKTAHGLSNDDIVIFKTTVALPSPLVADRDYYVKNKTDDTFNLAMTLGGSTIDTTTAGSGTHSLYARD